MQSSTFLPLYEHCECNMHLPASYKLTCIHRLHQTHAPSLGAGAEKPAKGGLLC